MANLPESTSTSDASSGAPSATGKDRSRMVNVENLVVELSNPSLRANSLHELSKMRDLFAPLLSKSFGTIAALLLVGTFIVEQILSVENGMKHICTSAGRLFQVYIVFGTMVVTLVQQPSCPLLKVIIRCYLRLSENQRACHALRTCLPAVLRDATFSSCLREHPTARRWLQQLLHNIRVNPVPAQQGGGGSDHMTGS